MEKRTREITVEEYRIIKKLGFIPTEIEEKYIDDVYFIAYGVYDKGVEEKDGKYYLWFETGDSCD